MSTSTSRTGFWHRLTHGRSIGFGLEYLGYVTLKHPKVIGILLVLLTVLSVWQVPKANVDGDLLRVYADSGKEYETYKRLADTFGTFENDIYLLVTSPRLTDPAVLERMRELALDLSLNQYAAGTLSAFSLRKPDGQGGTLPAVPEGMVDSSAIAAAMADLQKNDPMMRNLISPDLSGVVMILFPDPELSKGAGTKQMIAELKEMVASYESPDIHVELTGPPIWTAEMLNAAVDDQVKFTIYGFGLGALIALFALRSFWSAILVAATPFIAVLWTMGVVLLIFGSFSFLTIIVTTLVLVICFAESLFFIFNWLAYWRDGIDPDKAIGLTLSHVGPASTLSQLTTLIAFASLGFTPGQGTTEFAYAGVIACTLGFVGIMCFQPLILKLALRLGFKAPKAPNFALTAPVPLAWFLASRFGRLVSTLGAVVTILFIIPYFLIEPRFSFEDVMAEDSSALTAAEQIDQGVGGVAPLYVRVPLKEGVANVGDADFETIKTVHEILEKHLGENKVISAASFKHYADSGFTRDEIFSAVGPFMKRRFVTDDNTQALVTGFMPTIIASNDLKQLVAGIETDLAAANITDAEVGGFRILTSFATDNIVRNLQLALTGSVIINLFVIGFAFMSWRIGLVSVIPNLFPILGTEAYLWLSGAGLQLTTVLALTIAFGIAVNDTIHFLSHYVQERREHRHNHIEAVKQTLDRIGGAIIATTVILCAGTAIVAFSELPQVALFGQLFVTTLALALVGDLFILPALLVAGGRFFHPLGGIKMADAPHPLDEPDEPAPAGRTAPGE
ncbi:MAG: efflux RND transporter permease subunit [Devosia sp.]